MVRPTATALALTLVAAAAIGSVACTKEPQQGAAATAGSDALVGKAAPELRAKAHDGTDVQLSQLKGKTVVVYFYPKDETPGCTKEACSFRDAWGQLSKLDVVLIGVSSDSEESHKKFAENHKLPFLLLSDDGSIAKSFGVPVTMGFTSRQTVVIDKDGIVKKVYRKVDVATHTQEILRDVQP